MICIVLRGRADDRRTCPERERLLEGTRLLHYGLQAEMSRRDMQQLRLAIGDECGTVADFLAARDTAFDQVCEYSKLRLDPHDNLVRSGPASC
jgi:hypothetical protein